MCPQCKGSGWIITERHDVSGAERCPCSIPARRLESLRAPTPEEYAEGVSLMAQMIAFFPDGDAAHAFIAEQIASIIHTKGELDSFVRAACMKVGKWQGLSALWIAYESACEQLYMEREAQENTRRIEAMKKQYTRQLTASIGGHLLIEGACEMPKDRRPLKQVKSKVAALPKTPTRSAEEQQRLIDEIRRSLKQIESEVAALPRTPTRSGEERQRLIDEMRRYITEQAQADESQSTPDNSRQKEPANA